jgi:hypothetical protein
VQYVGRVLGLLLLLRVVSQAVNISSNMALTDKRANFVIC